MAKYTFYYNEDLVCSECGEQNYHMNLTFFPTSFSLCDDDECPTWCHTCETEPSLIESWEYELEQKSLKENKQ